METVIDILKDKLGVYAVYFSAPGLIIISGIILYYYMYLRRMDRDFYSSIKGERITIKDRIYNMQMYTEKLRRNVGRVIPRENNFKGLEFAIYFLILVTIALIVIYIK